MAHYVVGVHECRRDGQGRLRAGVVDTEVSVMVSIHFNLPVQAPPGLLVREAEIVHQSRNSGSLPLGDDPVGYFGRAALP
jgi:hypothetical protein